MPEKPARTKAKNHNPLIINAFHQKHAPKAPQLLPFVAEKRPKTAEQTLFSAEKMAFVWELFGSSWKNLAVFSLKRLKTGEKLGVGWEKLVKGLGGVVTEGREDFFWGWRSGGKVFNLQGTEAPTNDWKLPKQNSDVEQLKFHYIFGGL